MNIWDKLLYALSASICIVGLRTLFSWSYTSRLVGLSLIGISLIVFYLKYTKNKKETTLTASISTKNAILGILLIIIDVSYNLYANDQFRYFDYGMLLSGFFIIALNMGLLNFLKLDDQMVSFSTYFIFILLLVYGFLFTGITFLFNGSELSENIFFTLFTGMVVKVSYPILNLIKPTTIYGDTINFDGFRVGIGYACSGIESISVFISAVVAYIIATKEKNIKKFSIYVLIGSTALFFMNILRVMIIVLVGYYYGTEQMYFVHEHLGWVMFVLGMSIFWYLIMGE